MPIDLTVIRAAALGLSLLALSGCDTPPTQVDQYFGLSVQQAQMQQTQHLHTVACPMQSAHLACPASGHGDHPLRGHMGHPAARDSDGASVHSAIQRYQESFTSPMGAKSGSSLGNGSALQR